MTVNRWNKNKLHRVTGSVLIEFCGKGWLRRYVASWLTQRDMISRHLFTAKQKVVWPNTQNITNSCKSGKRRRSFPAFIGAISWRFDAEYISKFGRGIISAIQTECFQLLCEVLHNLHVTCAGHVDNSTFRDRLTRVINNFYLNTVDCNSLLR